MTKAAHSVVEAELAWREQESKEGTRVRTWPWLAGSLLLIVILLVGCGSDASTTSAPATSTPPTSTPATSAPATSAQATSDSSDVSFPLGLFISTTGSQFTFKSDGTFKYVITAESRDLDPNAEGDIVIENGSYTIDGETFIYRDPDFAPRVGCPIEATYQWSFDGETLLLETIQDDCRFRPRNLTRPWTLQDAQG